MALINYSACDIIKVAIEIEKSGYQFFTKAARLAHDKTVSELFQNLALEEIKHKNFLERLSKLITECKIDEETRPDEYLSAIADASIIQQKEGMKAIAEKRITDKQALDIAIQIKKNAILYYTELFRFVNKKEQGIMEELIKEVKNHLITLNSVERNLL